jgi:hypothetical protein
MPGSWRPGTSCPNCRICCLNGFSKRLARLTRLKMTVLAALEQGYAMPIESLFKIRLLVDLRSE